MLTDEHTLMDNRVFVEGLLKLERPPLAQVLCSALFCSWILLFLECLPPWQYL